MPNEPQELSETIKCGKKDCECDITVIDNYYINKPEVPQIGIKCPVCGKVTALSKAKSVAYAAEYAQIQEDIDVALGYKTSTGEDMDEFGDRVMRALDAFGYKGTKYAQVKRSIREMVDNVPSYQTFQGLHTLLIGMKIQPNHAMMATQRVFAAEQPSPLDTGMQQQMPYQQPMQQPACQYPPPMQQQMPYQQPMQQQMPYQQPTQQQMPYQQQPAQQQDESITITEKLGGDGQVIERVIKQPKPTEPTNGTTAQPNMADQFKEMIEVMTGAGMINTLAEPEPQPTIEDILEHLVPLINPPEPAEDTRYDSLIEEVKSLRAENTQREFDTLQGQIDTLTAELGNTASNSKLSDAQYSEGIRKDIENTRITAITESLDKLAKPMIEMQATQAKFQTMMMVRQVEQQDGAQPGTYAQMFSTAPVADDKVKSDIDKWKDRAGRAKA